MKHELVRFLITIEWEEEGKKKHLVLRVHKHKKDHYRAEVVHLRK